MASINHTSSCPNCGAPLPANATKCEYCGAQIIDEAKPNHEAETEEEDVDEVPYTTNTDIINDSPQKGSSVKSVILGILLMVAIISVIFGGFAACSLASSQSYIPLYESVFESNPQFIPVFQVVYGVLCLAFVSAIAFMSTEDPKLPKVIVTALIAGVIIFLLQKKYEAQYLDQRNETQKMLDKYRYFHLD